MNTAPPSPEATSRALPGQHLRPDPMADPAQIRAEVDALLRRLDGSGTAAPILEQAHDVLVRALATVDKI